MTSKRWNDADALSLALLAGTAAQLLAETRTNQMPQRRRNLAHAVVHAAAILKTDPDTLRRESVEPDRWEELREYAEQAAKGEGPGWVRQEWAQANYRFNKTFNPTVEGDPMTPSQVTPACAGTFKAGPPGPSPHDENCDPGRGPDCCMPEVTPPAKRPMRFVASPVEPPKERAEPSAAELDLDLQLNRAEARIQELEAENEAPVPSPVEPAPTCLECGQPEDSVRAADDLYRALRNTDTYLLLVDEDDTITLATARRYARRARAVIDAALKETP